jgi:hypothetical protein
MREQNTLPVNPAKGGSSHTVLSEYFPTRATRGSGGSGIFAKTHPEGFFARGICSEAWPLRLALSATATHARGGRWLAIGRFGNSPDAAAVGAEAEWDHASRARDSRSPTPSLTHTPRLGTHRAHHHHPSLRDMLKQWFAHAHRLPTPHSTLAHPRIERQVPGAREGEMERGGRWEEREGQRWGQKKYKKILPCPGTFPKVSP